MSEYGNILYTKSNKKSLEKLQKIQNTALKACLKLDKKTSTAEIHKKANINYLFDRREKALIKFMFHRTKQNKFLDTNSYNIERRSTTVPKLKIPTHKSTTAKKAINYHGSISWNNLNPYNLKKLPTAKQLHQKLKTLYKNKIKDY